jgi:hypothetical protein
MHNTERSWGKFKEGSLLALWRVAKEGYHVEDGLAADNLIRGDKQPKPYLVTEYDTGNEIYPVLGKKLIHRNFARLDPNDKDAIVHFADKYGFLGNPVAVFPSGGGQQSSWGELLSIWQNEITECGTLLTIWDMVKRGDRAAGKLGQIVLWPRPDMVAVSFYCKREGDGYSFTPGSRKPVPFKMPTFKLLASREVNPHLLNRWRRGDVIEPALFYVCSEINRHLRKQIGFQLFPFEKEIRTIPGTLDSVIWLMFAYEITDKVNAVQCSICHEWFDQHDKRQVYCSCACRQRAYRQRRGKGVNSHERTHTQTG